jgi:hypothetical protein
MSLPLSYYSSSSPFARTGDGVEEEGGGGAGGGGGSSLPYGVGNIFTARVLDPTLSLHNVAIGYQLDQSVINGIYEANSTSTSPETKRGEGKTFQGEKKIMGEDDDQGSKKKRARSSPHSQEQNNNPLKNTIVAVDSACLKNGIFFLKAAEKTVWKETKNFYVVRYFFC